MVITELNTFRAKWEVVVEYAVVIDEQCVAELGSRFTTNKLCDNLGPRAHPEVSNTMGFADGAGLVKWSGIVAIVHDEDVLCWRVLDPRSDRPLCEQTREDLQCRFQCRSNGSGRLVAWDEKASLFGLFTVLDNEFLVEDGIWL